MFDMGDMKAVLMFAVSLFAGIAGLVVTLYLKSTNKIISKYEKLKQAAIDNGCKAEGSLIKTNTHTQGEDGVLPHYTGIYEYFVDGKKYKAKIYYGLDAPPAVKTIYYIQGNPGRYLKGSEKGPSSLIGCLPVIAFFGTFILLTLIFWR